MPDCAFVTARVGDDHPPHLLAAATEDRLAVSEQHTVADAAEEVGVVVDAYRVALAVEQERAAPTGDAFYDRAVHTTMNYAPRLAQLGADGDCGTYPLGGGLGEFQPDMPLQVQCRNRVEVRGCDCVVAWFDC
jgi:hypothetical protein